MRKFFVLQIFEFGYHTFFVLVHKQNREKFWVYQLLDENWLF